MSGFCEFNNVKNILISVDNSNSGPIEYEIYNNNACCGEIIQSGTLDCNDCENNIYEIIPLVIIPSIFSIKIVDQYGCETCICGVLQTPTPIEPTPTRTPTVTPSLSFTPTPSNTVTPGLTPTATPQPTPTQTQTPTVTNTPTRTPTATPQNTPTPTATPQPTPTNTPTPSITPNSTQMVTPTPTKTMTPTRTPTPTLSNTSQNTPTPTKTITPTTTPTNTPTPSNTPREELIECNVVNMDIVIINDESSSIGLTNYYNFIVLGIINIINNLSTLINNNQIRIALVGFGTNIYNRVELSFDYSYIYNTINNLPYENGLTFTVGGLNGAYEIINNDNRNVLTKFILITDGNPSKCILTNPPSSCTTTLAKQQTIDVATIIKNTIKGGSNIELYTIGVGNNIDNNLLSNNIATSPSYHFIANTFEDFEDISFILSENICENLPSPTQPPVVVSPTPTPTNTITPTPTRSGNVYTGICYQLIIDNNVLYNNYNDLYIETKLPGQSNRKLVYYNYESNNITSTDYYLYFCSEISPIFSYGEFGDNIMPSGIIINSGGSCNIDSQCNN